MTDAKDLLQVKRGEGAAFPFEGTMTYLKEGLIAHKDHPIVKGREAHFEPLLVHFDIPEPPEPDEAGEPKTKGKLADEEEQSERSDASTAGTVKSAAARTQGSRAR